MLAVQPVSINTYPKKVSFQKNEGNDLKEDKEFFEQQKQEIEALINDSKLPNGMRKFLNVANIITDGLIAGFTVACATIASASCGKKTYGKLTENKMLQNVLGGFKPVGEYAGKGIKILKHQAANLVRKIFGNEKGQAIVDFAKNAIKKVKGFINKINPFKSEAAYDKATTSTATGLGVGAGAASAYAKTVEKSEQDGEE